MRENLGFMLSPGMVPRHYAQVLGWSPGTLGGPTSSPWFPFVLLYAGELRLYPQVLGYSPGTLGGPT